MPFAPDNYNRVPDRDPISLKPEDYCPFYERVAACRFNESLALNSFQVIIISNLLLRSFFSA